MPDVRMNSFSALRFASCSGKPCAAARRAPSAVVTVAPMTRIPGRFARTRATTSLMRSCTPLQRRVAVLAEVVDAFEPDHCGDARQLEHVALDARCRPRARRGMASPAHTRWARHLVAADAGVDHGDAVAVVACSRRDSTSGQRSSPFMVEAVPSVIESPNATIAAVRRAPSCRPRRGRTTTRC